MLKIDFNKPANLIDLNKKLNIKEIKHILINLKWDRNSYAELQKFCDNFGTILPPTDFDLIEALQTIFNYCNNNVALCKITYIFNTYVKVTEDIDYYEAYGYGEDKIYSVGYELKMNIPDKLREKIINLSNQILKERENQIQDWY